jgi:EmrB/QacA subfamily drug resistance transporter
VTAPLYGKLGDLYGRKRLLQAAIVLFLAGSALCGLSRDMTELIVFRAIQGLGGGGLMVTTVAVVGDIIPPRQRGRYQGYFGAVFGVSTVIGPLLGGFFVDNLSWRWIFYVNLPLGAVALVVIGAVFRSRGRTASHRIDVLGAAVLAGSLAAIVLFTSLGGTTYAWSSAPILVMIAAGVLLLALFPLIESRAAEPILPLELFSNATFSVAGGVGFIIGFALFGSVTYLPLYLQIVRGHSPTESGLQMTPMMLGVLVTSIASGNLITRFGRYKPFPIAGTAVTALGLYLLSGLAVGTSTAVTAGYMIVLGLGLGMVMQVLVLAVQNAVDYRMLGVATSGSTLFRQVGGSIGVSLFGAIFSNRLGTELAARLPAGAHPPATASPAAVSHLSPAVHRAYVEAFAASLHPVYLAAAGVAVAGFVLAWFLRELPLRQTARAEGVGESFASPRDASSERELERIVSTLMQREERQATYRRLIARSGVEIEPAAGWLLARLRPRGPIAPAALGTELDVPADRIERLLGTLAAGGLVVWRDGLADVTAAGAETVDRLVAAGREELCQMLEGWKPREDADLAPVLRRMATALVAEMPA